MINESGATITFVKIAQLVEHDLAPKIRLVPTLARIKRKRLLSTSTKDNGKEFLLSIKNKMRK